MSDANLTNCLKVLRAQYDLTQEALAEEIGMTRKSINAIEKKRMIPSVVTALKLAGFFKVTVDQIFTLER